MNININLSFNNPLNPIDNTSLNENSYNLTTLRQSISKPYLKQFLVKQGVINQNYEVQDLAKFPPLAFEQIQSKLFQEFLCKPIPYKYQINQEVLETLKNQLLRGVDDENEIATIEAFVAEVSQQTFEATLSFKDILDSFQELDKENHHFEVVAGWFLYILTNDPELFHDLFYTFLKSHGVESEDKFYPHSYRYRPEMDLKVFINKEFEKLLVLNDHFLEAFIKKFNVNSVYDLYYYRVLFKFFLPKSSPAFANTVVGHEFHKLDVLFLNQKAPPLFSTDCVSFTLKEKHVFHALGDRPISVDKYEILQFTYTNLADFYQCLINIYFGVDHLKQRHPNDKVIPRIISRMTLGFFFPKQELNAIVKASLKSRSLAQLLQNFHENHHEGNSELFLALIINTILQLYKSPHQEHLEGIWEHLSHHINFDKVSSKLLKTIYLMFQARLPFDLVEKALQIYAILQKDCSAGIEDDESNSFFKIALDHAIHIFVPFVPINFLFDFLNALKSVHFFDEIFPSEWLQSPQEIPLHEKFDHQEKFLIDKIFDYYRQPHPCLQLNSILLKLCRVYPFKPLQTFAKKIELVEKSEYKTLLITHFIAYPISYSLAYPLLWKLKVADFKKIFNQVLASQVKLSMRHGILFLEDCLVNGFVDREMIKRIFSYYKPTDIESSFQLQNFLIKIHDYLPHLTGERYFYDSLQVILQNYMSNNPNGINFYNQITLQEEISEDIALLLLKNTVKKEISHISQYVVDNSQDAKVSKPQYLLNLHSEYQQNPEKFREYCKTHFTQAEQFLCLCSYHQIFSPQLFKIFVEFVTREHLPVPLKTEIFDAFSKSINHETCQDFAKYIDFNYTFFQTYFREHLFENLDCLENFYSLKLVSKKNCEALVTNTLEIGFNSSQTTSFENYLKLLEFANKLNLSLNYQFIVEYLFNKLPLNAEKIEQLYTNILSLNIQSKVTDILVKQKFDSLSLPMQKNDYNAYLKFIEKLISNSTFSQIFLHLVKCCFENESAEVFLQTLDSLSREYSFERFEENTAGKIFEYLEKALTKTDFTFGLTFLLDKQTKIVFKGRENLLIRSYLTLIPDQYDCSLAISKLLNETLIQKNSFEEVHFSDFILSKYQGGFLSKPCLSTYLDYLLKNKQFPTLLRISKHLCQKSQDASLMESFLLQALTQICNNSSSYKEILPNFEEFYAYLSYFKLSPAWLNLFQLLLKAQLGLNSKKSSEIDFIRALSTWLHHHKKQTSLLEWLPSQTKFIQQTLQINDADLDEEGRVFYNNYLSEWSEYFTKAFQENPKNKNKIFNAGFFILKTIFAKRPLLILQLLETNQFNQLADLKKFIVDNPTPTDDKNYWGQLMIFFERHFDLKEVLKKKSIQEHLWILNYLLDYSLIKKDNLATLHKGFILAGSYYDHAAKSDHEEPNLARNLANIYHKLPLKLETDVFKLWFQYFNRELYHTKNSLIALFHVLPHVINTFAPSDTEEYFNHCITQFISYVEFTKEENAKIFYNRKNDYWSCTLITVIDKILLARGRLPTQANIYLAELIKIYLLEQPPCSQTLIFINNFLPASQLKEIHPTLLPFMKAQPHRYQGMETALTIFLNKLLQGKLPNELAGWINDLCMVYDYPAAFFKINLDLYKHLPNHFTQSFQLVFQLYGYEIFIQKKIDVLKSFVAGYTSQLQSSLNQSLYGFFAKCLLDFQHLNRIKNFAMRSVDYLRKNKATTPEKMAHLINEDLIVRILSDETLQLGHFNQNAAADTAKKELGLIFFKICYEKYLFHFLKPITDHSLLLLAENLSSEAYRANFDKLTSAMEILINHIRAPFSETESNIQFLIKILMQKDFNGPKENIHQVLLFIEICFLSLFDFDKSDQKSQALLKDYKTLLPQLESKTLFYQEHLSMLDTLLANNMLDEETELTS